MTEEKTPEYVVDEELDGSLRYRETIGDDDGGTFRDCTLWVPGNDKQVSCLRFYDFEQRFGSVAVPVEGIGNVNTNPEHRRKGYISTLMRRALAGSADRVDASFLFGISRLYGNFGFTSCLAASWFTLWLKYAEGATCPDTLKAESLKKEDVPAVNALFNKAHGFRPWTRVRTDTVALRLFNAQAWKPGPETIVWKEGETIRAYAVMEGYGYGWGHSALKVIEATADAPDSALAMMSHLREKGLERGVDTVNIHEPADSAIGRTVRLMGGKYYREYNADGGGMGLILNRNSLIDAMEEELARRAGNLNAVSEICAALKSGELIPDSARLMRLLTGYFSWEDAKHAGEHGPDGFGDTLAVMFPGGGTQTLHEPFAHRLDGY